MKFSKLEKSSTYNRFLSEGILETEAGNYDAAIHHFNKALKIYKNKMEPHFYKACLSIQAFRKS
jgi:tetratricopeptide (TPR) repeat protein